MTQSIRTSFIANAENEEELINVLLAVAGFTRESFTLYMDTTAEIMAQNPLWVKKYLEDTINANLVHIGYVIKDTRQEGMLGEYREAVKELSEKSLIGEAIQNPFIINDEIINETGTIRISIPANATRLIQNIL